MNKNPKMQGWKVWYADGSVYSSDQFQWHDLPHEGVQIVVVYQEPPYRLILNGADWYYLAPNGIIEIVKSDSWNDYRPRPCNVPYTLIKCGTGIPSSKFKDLYKQALEEKQWP